MDIFATCTVVTLAPQRQVLRADFYGSAYCDDMSALESSPLTFSELLHFICTVSFCWSQNHIREAKYIFCIHAKVSQDTVVSFFEILEI